MTIIVDQWYSVGAADPIPTVAMAPDGSFMVVWPRHSGTDWDVWYRLFDSDGVPAAAPARVNVALGGDQQAPVLVADGFGRFVAVWSGYPSAGLGARVFDPVQNDWGNELALATATDARNPSVAAHDTGFVIAWIADSGAGAEDDVLAGRFDFDGVLQDTSIAVSGNASGEQHDASVAATALGAFVVSWSGPRESRVADLFWRRFNADGTPATPLYLATGGNEPSRYRDQSVVRFDGENIVLIWRSIETIGGPARLRGWRWPASDNFRRGIVVSQCGCLVDSHPRLAVDAAGNLAVTWETTLEEDGTVGIHVQTFDDANQPLLRW